MTYASKADWCRVKRVRVASKGLVVDEYVRGEMLQELVRWQGYLLLGVGRRVVWWCGGKLCWVGGLGW